jgi:hypothetical protein
VTPAAAAIARKATSASRGAHTAATSAVRLASYAQTLGKPIVAYTGGAPPHPWTVYVADAVCDALEGAVQAACAHHK